MRLALARGFAARPLAFARFALTVRRLTIAASSASAARSISQTVVPVCIATSAAASVSPLRDSLSSVARTSAHSTSTSSSRLIVVSLSISLDVQAVLTLH